MQGDILLSPNEEHSYRSKLRKHLLSQSKSMYDVSRKVWQVDQHIIGVSIQYSSALAKETFFQLRIILHLSLNI